MNPLNNKFEGVSYDVMNVPWQQVRDEVDGQADDCVVYQIKNIMAEQVWSVVFDRTFLQIWDSFENGSHV